MSFSLFLLLILLNICTCFVYYNHRQSVCRIHSKLLQLRMVASDDVVSLRDKRLTRYLDRKQKKPEISDDHVQPVAKLKPIETSKPSTDSLVASGNAQKMFDILRGSQPKLTIDEFLIWPYIKNNLGRKLISRDRIYTILDEVGFNPLNLGLDLEDFINVVLRVNDEVVTRQTELDKRREMIRLDKVRERKRKSGGPDYDDSNDPVGEREMIEESAAPVTPEDVLQDSYKTLKEKFGTVTAKSLNDWEEIQKLLSCGALTQTQVTQAIKALKIRDTVSMDKLRKFVSSIDDLLDRSKMNTKEFHDKDRYSK